MKSKIKFYLPLLHVLAVIEWFISIQIDCWITHVTSKRYIAISRDQDILLAHCREVRLHLYISMIYIGKQKTGYILHIICFHTPNQWGQKIVYIHFHQFDMEDLFYQQKYILRLRSSDTHGVCVTTLSELKCIVAAYSF